jgi:hypothetical protein
MMKEISVWRSSRCAVYFLYLPLMISMSRTYATFCDAGRIKKRNQSFRLPQYRLLSSDVGEKCVDVKKLIDGRLLSLDFHLRIGLCKFIECLWQLFYKLLSTTDVGEKGAMEHRVKQEGSEKKFSEPKLEFMFSG